MSRQPQKRNATSWAPGQSGNPKGRPRVGLALAEKIREDIAPEEITALARAVLTDTSISAKERLSVLMPFVQLGYYRPPSSAAIALETSSSAPSYDFSGISPDKIREALAVIREAREAAGNATTTETPRSAEPQVSDEDRS